MSCVTDFTSGPVILHTGIFSEGTVCDSSLLQQDNHHLLSIFPHGFPWNTPWESELGSNLIQGWVTSLQAGSGGFFNVELAFSWAEIWEIIIVWWSEFGEYCSVIRYSGSWQLVKRYIHPKTGMMNCEDWCFSAQQNLVSLVGIAFFSIQPLH